MASSRRPSASQENLGSVARGVPRGPNGTGNGLYANLPVCVEATGPPPCPILAAWVFVGELGVDIRLELRDVGAAGRLTASEQRAEHSSYNRTRDM